MGKPAWCRRHAQRTESIGAVRQTRGTETSKYPEEKKTIVIPSVAASERGRAKTKGIYSLGVVGRQTAKSRGVERSGKAGHSR